MMVLFVGACFLIADSEIAAKVGAAAECTQPSVWFADGDADGYGDASTTTSACVVSAGWVENATDCDDALGEVYPGAPERCNGLDDDCDGTADDDVPGAPTWYADDDEDGVGDDSSPTTACEQPEGHVAEGGDCDDHDDDVGVAGTWYTDADGDEYGADATALTSCEPIAGAVTTGGDCDDTSTAYHPGADESDCADPADYNCDGSTGYVDTDGDGYPACEECDDADAAAHPGADETCDGDDEDCDGDIDEGDAVDVSTWYADTDGDGHGDRSVSVLACTAPAGFEAAGDDCDDGDASVSPSGTELCNDVDDDCNGAVDDGAIDAPTWYADADTDGYGDDSVPATTCDQPEGYVATGGDCDDTDTAYNPDAAESDCSDPADYNCDGATGYADGDGDGYAACEDCDDGDAAVSPGALEDCGTPTDDDCTGSTNDPGASDCLTYYADADLDAYGSASSQCTCTPTGDYTATNDDDCDDTNADAFPGAASNDSSTSCMTDADGDDYGDDTVSGSVVAGTDCNDADAAVAPGAAETCTTTYDDNCDGSTNDIGSVGCTTYYYDADNDGYGLASLSQCTCSSSGSYDVTNSTDCDDADSDTFPGAASSDSTTSCMNDDDGDNYGDDGVSGSVVAGTDCDDASSSVRPGATETCSTTYDDDCDGTTNDSGATGCTTYYYDGDNDGYGASTSWQCTCSSSGSYDVTNSTDCDDSDDTVNPGESDLLAAGDGIDNDCDGYIDEDGLAHGDLVVSEFMVAGAYTTDWFELYNANANDIALDGFTITLCHDDETALANGDASLITCESEVVLTVEAGHTVPAGEYFVLCGSAINFTSATVCPSGATSSAGDRFTDYDSPAYASSNDLEAGCGGIVVESGGTTIDEVWWWQSTGSDDWPTSSSSSVQLDDIVLTGGLAADENDDYSSDTASPYAADIWCLSTDAGVTSDYSASSTEYGTPGSVNEPCP